MNHKAPGKERSAATKERETRQLRRLETLMDVVFALLLVNTFLDLPKPTRAEFDTYSLWEILTNQSAGFETVLIAAVFILIYWLQNNLLLGNLQRTDGKHASLAILQIVALLFYVYFVSLGIDLGEEPSILAAQSISLALVGFMAIAGWRHASRGRRLVDEALTDEEAGALQITILSEPLTALLTLPFVFNSGTWALVWLAYIPIGWLLRRRKRAAERP